MIVDDDCSISGIEGIGSNNDCRCLVVLYQEVVRIKTQQILALVRQNLG